MSLLQTRPSSSRRWIPAAIAIVLTLLTISANAQKYTRTDLTTDSSSVSPAPNIDPNLVNAWGLARSSGSPWWVTDNGTGLSTLYDGNGVPKPLVVTIPKPGGGTSAPNGIVFNYTNGFPVGGSKSLFIFSTEDGTISAWNGGPSATIVVDNSASAEYKGAALLLKGATPQLYVTNFTTGKVEAYDANFKPVKLTTTAFTLPDLDQNWSAFGIQNVGGNLIVTFAWRKPGDGDETHGAGLGHVAIFDGNGKLLLRLQDGAWFNAPWGVALAPGDFGAFNHRLLIGQFGDGSIHAFNAVSGAHLGFMQDASGARLRIDGLWGLSFGNDSGAGLATVLYFGAGPDDESHGIFGMLTPVASDQRGNSE